MNAIQRHIFRQVTISALLMTGGVTFAVWVTQSLRFIEYIVDRGLPVSHFLALVGLMVPAFLQLVLPIALFASVLFVYSKLLSDNEIVVLRSAGMSQPQLARPVVAVGVLAVAIEVAISLYFLPVAYREFKDWQFTIRNEYSSIVLQEGVFNRLIKGVTVYVDERAPDGRLFGIVIHDARDPLRQTTMLAEQGVVAGSAAGPKLLLVGGRRQELDRETMTVRTVAFDEYAAEFDLDRRESKGRFREAEERFIGELFAPDPSDTPRRKFDSFAAEGHQRIVGPLYALIFPLIAAAALLSGEFNRRGHSARIVAACLGVVALQSASLGLLNAAANTPIVTPAMYVLPAVTIALCLWILVRAPRRRTLAVPAGAAAAE